VWSRFVKKPSGVTRDLCELYGILVLLKKSRPTLPSVCESVAWLDQFMRVAEGNSAKRMAAQKSSRFTIQESEQLKTIENIEGWLNGKPRGKASWYLADAEGRNRTIEFLDRFIARIESGPYPKCEGAYEVTGTLKNIASAKVTVVLPPDFQPSRYDSPVAVIVSLGHSSIVAESALDRFEGTARNLVRRQQEA
jgi:hypothetical protein